MIIRAHLRGLIKPYYSNGLRSVGAENLMFLAIAMEDAGKAKERELATEREILHLLKADAVGRRLRKIHHLAVHAHRLCSLVNVDPAKTDDDSVQAMINLYHALEKQGIITNTEEEPEDV